MTKYAYHRVPENMLGTIIKPLVKLKLSHPEIYHQAMNKYVGRESLFDVTLNHFNGVKFGEFSNFLIIDPQLWIQDVKSYNLLPQDKSFLFYKVPINYFDTESTRVFRYTPEYKSPFDPLEELEVYNMDFILDIPKYTLDYYKEISQSNERLVFYHLLPHLITTQEIDIESCEIIEVS